MLRRNKKSKSIIRIYGLVMFFAGLFLCLFRLGYSHYIEKLEMSRVNRFIVSNSISLENEIEYEDSYDHYIGVLEIAKINLKRGFYNIDSVNNSVSKGIEVISQSNMPDVKYGSLILAAHSGNGQVSYFSNLYKLSYGDIICIYYGKGKYVYELIDIYEIEKNDMISINKKSNITSLFLITCSKDNDDMQVVYAGKLIEVY